MFSEQKDTPKSAPGDGKSLRLSIRGLSHVISFKNRKRAILDRNTGKMRTLTEPKAAKWMKACIELFESRLFSEYLTSADGMRTGRSLRSWIASYTPASDSVNAITEINVKVERVPVGEEGADILIERL